jgi:hypothetical protein
VMELKFIMPNNSTTVQLLRIMEIRVNILRIRIMWQEFHGFAWNPDNEFKGFVKSTLKTSGYDLVDFGYN